MQHSATPVALGPAKMDDPAAGDFHPDMGLAELVRLGRRARTEVATGQPLKLAILANFSTQFLTVGLELALRSRGFAPQVFEAGYNQWERELVDPAAEIASFQPDIILLTLTSALLHLREQHSDADRCAKYVADLVEGASRRLAARFVVTLPDPLEEEVEQTGWAYAWRQQFTRALTAGLGGRAVLVDLAPLVAQVGAADWYSARFLVTKKLPANPQTSARHADYLATTIAAVARKPVRLVITDLDDTLWGGVVGEVGWEGVNLDAEGEGFGALRLQRFLLGLHQRGVLLAICSKNNPEDALEVFRRRPEMLLREQHFADIRINWEPKSLNVKATLDALKLTPPGTVLLDDSPFERGEVCAAFPEVWAPDFPADAVDLVPLLARSGRFALPVMTAEDRQRNERYVTERQRQQTASAAGTAADYYRALNLILVPQPLSDENFQRVLDLIAKTNQFNVTTRRYGRADLVSLAQQPGTEVWTYALSDRFGDYGTVSVAILRTVGGDLVIDTWLMSCRAMGRTAERGIFRHIYERAGARAANRIFGEYIATAKNKPVENLFPQLGFASSAASADGAQFVFAVAQGEPGNEYVAIRPGHAKA